jgi:hypothetical protein
MLAGFEVGIPPFSALRRIFPVNGKTEMETQLLMGLVKAADPTAQFVFHRYEADGADVELFRNGVSVLRCTYTEADRDRSKQGYKKMGQWKQGQNGRNYFEAVKDANGKIKYEADEESPWFKYPRDMYAYNAVKRCCRLGAPDAINMIGFRADAVDAPYRVTLEERARGDEDAAPVAPLTKALREGQVRPEAVFGSEDTPPPPDDDEPDEDEAPAPDEHGEREQDGAANAPLTTAPPVEATAPPAPTPPTLGQMVAEIKALMVAFNDTWDKPTYTALYREMRDKYTPEASGKFEPTKLSDSQAQECLAALRQKRGAPAPA